MCKTNYVVNKLVLGNRELGYECWDGKQVCEYTSKQLKDFIKSGKQKVCGLRLSESGDLELDQEGFFTTNLMEHSHMGSYKPLNDSLVNLLYVCVGMRTVTGKQLYECISSRFERLLMTEADMRDYVKMGFVTSGAKLDGDKIVLANHEEKMVDGVKAPVLQKSPVVETDKK